MPSHLRHLAAALTLLLFAGARAEDTPRSAPPASTVDDGLPNIILFVVDDLGWQDASVPFHDARTPFNDRYRTPHLERLAAEGMRFTNAYAASPVCTPTRTSIMTGRNPARTHITNWTLHNDRKEQETGPETYPLRSPAWNVGGLQPGDVTLPAVLRDHGYRTIHVGKAHFGALGTRGADPRNLGFDVNIGGHAAGGPGSYYGTHDFSAAHRGGSRTWDVPGLERYHGRDVNLTDALTREAGRAIEEAVAQGRPFFVNMAHYAVHAPLMPDDRFAGHYVGLDAAEAAYASMVEGVDASLGALIEKLEALGVADRTLILYTSDNGGLSAHSRGRTPMGTGPNTHNLPLRSGKGAAYEGGIRVPTVVAWARSDRQSRWQRRLPLSAGTTTSVPVISDDVFPTLLEVAGADAPAGYATDGTSLVPLLRGEGAPARDALFWHYPHKWGPEGPGLDPFTAVRLDDWKLIYFYKDRRWELYDLGRDLSETTNLAWRHPDRARRLAARMHDWMRAVGAQPPVDRATGRTLGLPDVSRLGQ